MSRQYVFVLTALTFIVSMTGGSRRSWADEKTTPIMATDQPIEKILDRKVSLKFSGPLKALPEFLLDKYRMNVLLDLRALNNAGIDYTLPLSIDIANVSLREVIRLLVQDYELVAVPHHSVLSITTRDKANDILTTRIIPVSDLLDDVRFDDLIGCIVEVVDPESWDVVGGPGSIQGFRESLVISQDDETQRRIAELLRTLRTMRARRDTRPSEKRAIMVDHRNFNHLWKKLGTKCSFEVEDEELQQVVVRLGNKVGLKFQLDLKSLNEAGISPNTPVTFEKIDLPLRDILFHVLGEYELTWIIDGEVIMITTVYKAAETLLTCVYPVRDLAPMRHVDLSSIGQTGAEGGGGAGFSVPSGKGPTVDGQSAKTTFQESNRLQRTALFQYRAFGGLFTSRPTSEPGRPFRDFGAIIDVITSAISPESWDEVGGAGTIIMLEGLGVMIVSNRLETQIEIAKLMKTLRAAKAKETHDLDALSNFPQLDDNYVQTWLYTLTLDAEDKKQARGKKDGKNNERKKQLFTADDLAQLIRDNVAAGSWNDRTNTYVRAYGTVLAVRNRTVVQRQVWKVLSQIGVVTRVNEIESPKTITKQKEAASKPATTKPAVTRPANSNGPRLPFFRRRR